MTAGERLDITLAAIASEISQPVPPWLLADPAARRLVADGITDADVIYSVCETAAVMEYDGKHSRKDAEAYASGWALM